jgi:hypothetical protein
VVPAHPIRNNAVIAEKMKFLIIFNPFHCAIAWRVAIILQMYNGNFIRFIKILQNFEILMGLRL